MKAVHSRLKFYCIIFSVTLLIGTLAFMKIEGITAGEAFYFSIVTISSVGYGDIHPTTHLG